MCEAPKREYVFLGGFDHKKGTDVDHFGMKEGMFQSRSGLVLGTLFTRN